MADTIPTLREAAQQALEALCECELFIRVIGLDSQPAAKVAESARATITALRAALAEQAAEQGVPSEHRPDPEWYARMIRETAGDDFVVGPAFKLPEQAEPVAEPAGWALVRTPITEEMHAAAAKVLVRAHGLDGTPQRMLDAMIAAAPPAPARQEPLDITYADGCEPNAQLTELADRIDNEMLWSTPLFERDSLSQEQRDRLNAGVALRRYAHLLGQNRWSIFSPNGSYSFSADTLERVIELALRRQERAARALGITAAPAEGGAA